MRRLSGGSAFAVDDGADDMAVLPDDFVRLRYSLTEAEVDRYRRLGADAGAALERAVRAVQKGMTEAEAAGLTAKECLSAGIAPGVRLVVLKHDRGTLLVNVDGHKRQLPVAAAAKRRSVWRQRKAGI